MASTRERVAAEQESIERALRDLESALARPETTVKVISQALADEIFPYLTFRHFFVHAYGFMLDDEPILKLSAKIQAVHIRFVAEVEAALQKIENIG